MFDEIYYDGHKYQTKDTPDQALTEYKIQVDQDSGHSFLWKEEFDAEWIKDENDWLGGHLKESNHRWVCCHDFDGLIRFYRADEENGGIKNDAWVEYKALFMDGKIIKITKTENENIMKGAEILSDKGYEVSTLEDYEEFVRKRNERN